MVSGPLPTTVPMLVYWPDAGAGPEPVQTIVSARARVFLGQVTATPLSSVTTTLLSGTFPVLVTTYLKASVEAEATSTPGAVSASFSLTYFTMSIAGTAGSAFAGLLSVTFGPAGGVPTTVPMLVYWPAAGAGPDPVQVITSATARAFFGHVTATPLSSVTFTLVSATLPLFVTTYVNASVDEGAT